MSPTHAYLSSTLYTPSTAVPFMPLPTMALPSQVQTLAATQTELSQEGPQVYPIRSIDPRSKRQREHHILQNYPAPNHMLPPPDGSPAKPLYHMLCFTMFGQPSLEPIWAAIALHRYANDDEIWDNGITDTQNRLGNMIVVVSYFQLKVPFNGNTFANASLVIFHRQGSSSHRPLR